MTYVFCKHCGYARPARKACPNPACWPGMKAWHKALRAWERERDAYVAAHSGNTSAFREFFERDNPRPRASDYEAQERKEEALRQIKRGIDR